MVWTEAQTKEIEERMAGFSAQRCGEIDSQALMLFCHVKMLGLGAEELPGTAPWLNREQVAKFRMLAMLCEATQPFRQPAMSGTGK